MVTTTAAVTASSLDPVRTQLEQSAGKFLDFLGCKNVHHKEVPPITTREQFNDFFEVYMTSPIQPHYEAWFVSRLGFRTDPINRGTFTEHQQVHNMRIIGTAWHNTYDSTYEYIQDQTEKLALLLEKNKGNLSSANSEEIRNINASFTPLQQFGEHYFYASETTFDVLMQRVESGGRV